MHRYGLIGYPLQHSFSQKYFTEKFERENIPDSRYDLFPMPDLKEFRQWVAAHPELCGLNVTIPHKVAVMPYLDDLDETARAVGAVNVIRIRNNRLTGFNSDAVGFEQSLRNWLASRGYARETWRKMRALLLGTGGAAKAVAFALGRLQIGFVSVSRTPKPGQSVSYDDLKTFSAGEFTLIVNTTPLGMSPAEDTCPDIPFSLLDNRHLVYDLVYNPAETLLLQRAKARGAAVKNGLEMLQLQAEAAWAIWQDRTNH